MRDKRSYNKPVMAIERFVVNEYVAGCDFKWKYQGTAVNGDYINQGTYDQNYDFWSRSVLNFSWQWQGDPQIANNWNSNEAASFLTNTDLGGSVPSSSEFYSGVEGETYSYWALYDNRKRFNPKDHSVYKYTYNNTVYYSGDPFERSRNYS